jgi:hypothetical protein
MRASQFAIMVLVLTLCGCTPYMDRDSAAIRRSVGSLIYVGEDSIYRTGLSTDPPGVGPHGIKAQEFPKRLEEERQYVFHRKKTSENSWTVLERDLRANGATIIEAPIGNMGLAYTYIGGPFFVIEFRIRHYRCSIQNFMASTDDLAKMSPDMMREDFVLTVNSVDY